MPLNLQNARELFLHAVGKLPPEEWEGYVVDACGGNADLAQEVRSLLQVHREAGSFLDAPAPGLGATINHPSLERPGTQIGPYKLLQQIGEGGFGVVFMAEQLEPVQRRVALKIIKPGMDSRQVIARFTAEKQALAMMDHVNIARVLDAGATEQGRPYFVMELVHGVPITKYCDDNHLTPRQRLELFVPVCQAIQHAHQKGIIHRDIKPSNVMVTLYDSKPVPKVIDFGVAKAMEQKLTEQTLFTQYGTMVGTLEYMSPEQAEMSGLGVDTRSDIYSLGVLLYELLTGSTPLSRKQMKEAAYGEILRLIREEEPPKPSTRLSDSGEALASISAQRHTEPAKLSKLMRGELDWIVMKTLEKDRGRRYETASNFAADVQRYLDDEPVQACPPSAAYRFRKFARRNRGTLATVAVVSLALVLGTVVSTYQAVRATRQRDRAVAAEDLAQIRLESESRARRDAELARQDAEVQRQLAERSFQKARQAVDEYFTVVSESTLLDVPGLQPLRKQLLEAAQRYYEAILQQRGEDPAVLTDLAVAYLRLGNIYHEVNLNDDGLAAVDSALELLDRLRQEYPRAVDHHRRLAGYWKVDRSVSTHTEMPKDPVAAQRTLTKFLDLWEAFARENPVVEGFRNDLAHINALLGKLEGGNGYQGEAAAFPRAVAYSRKATLIWEQLAQGDPGVPSYRENLVTVYSELAWELAQAGHEDQSREASSRAMALCEQLAAEFPTVLMYRALLANRLASLADRLAVRQPPEAEKVVRRAVEILQKLATDFPTAPEYRQALGRAYQWTLPGILDATGRPQEAEQAHRQALAIFEKLTEDFPQEASHWHDLGFAHGNLLNWDQAIAARTKAIELKPNFWDAWHWRGCAYANLGKWDKAVADQTKALELYPQQSSIWYRRGQAYSALRQWDNAIPDYARAIELGATDSDLWLSTATAHANLGQPDQAEAAYRRFFELKPGDAGAFSSVAWDLATSPDPKIRNPRFTVELAQKAVLLAPNERSHWTTLGAAHYRAGSWNASIDAVQKSIELSKAGAAADLFILAMAHWQLGEKDEARKRYDDAVEWMDKNKPQDEELQRFRAEASELLGVKKKKD